MPATTELKIGGKSLSVSNLDKILYPTARFTKGQVIEFYIKAAKYLLPHLKNRPVTLKRYPDGIHGEAFWEKDAPAFKPDFVKTFAVPRKLESGDIHYILINDVRTLAWCASVATIELHPFLHCIDDISRPTAIAFDLDPGEGVGVLQCAEVVLQLKELLDRLKLKAFPKVSGSKGIQLWVPLNTPITYDATKTFAKAIAELLHRQHPDRIVSEMDKALRRERVFIDWSQNIETKTTVGVYSLRAKREHPYVSVPVKWEELKSALKRGKPEMLQWEPEAALERLRKVGDLFTPVLKIKQRLPEAFVQQVPASEPRSKRLRSPKALERYAAKRNFTRTSEPAPLPRRSMQGGKRRFVVQKHQASHLHYDLRLEVSHTLKSWAVPKGLPTQLHEPRSAFAVEDHPLDYMTFEGVIPEGQYGGGTVMVWDIGTYEVLEGNVWKGYLRVFFNGKKLKGEWLLEQRRGERTEKPVWTITKVGKPAKIAKKLETVSALSGRTLEEIAEAKDRIWNSNRSEPERATAKRTSSSPFHSKKEVPSPTRAAKKRTAPQSTPATFVSPMLATRVEKLPEGDDWLYEWKWDGYRCIAVKNSETVHLFSRKGKDQKATFARVTDAVKTIHAETAVLDGEIVAMNEQGELSFQMLQNRSMLPPGWHIVFIAFDLLHCNGENLRENTLQERKQQLARVVENSGVLLSPALDGNLSDLIATGKKTRREGLVAKRRDSHYDGGNRSRTWLKLQLKPRQEFVIGGYRPGGRHRVELLLVGYYQGGKLLFAGKVRNQLNPTTRQMLHRRLHPLETKRCPFTNLPNSKRDHFGETVTAEEMENYTWVKPELVAEVSFAEWTRGEVLRHADFLGLREDKDAGEVKRES